MYGSNHKQAVADRGPWLSFLLLTDSGICKSKLTLLASKV
jgi:hypothetical protein